MRITSVFGVQKSTSLIDYSLGILERFIRMEVQNNNNNNNYVEEEGLGEDQTDSGSRTGVVEEERAEAVTGSTQTDAFDTVDCMGGNGVSIRDALRNGHGSNGRNGQEGGLFSNLMTLVLPTKRKNEEEHDENLSRNKRCASTQTEESRIAIRGNELCNMVIQELALEIQVPSSSKDEVYEALCSCITEILEKHAILFTGMLRRFEVTDYRVFTSIANELFEANADSINFKITWGRIVSLFAFAVKLAQKYRETQEEDKIDNVVNYLSDYISRHLLDFVEREGGWEGLVKQFPLSDSEDKQVKRAMMWSGLCVGLVATMYVSSFLSK